MITKKEGLDIFPTWEEVSVHWKKLCPEVIPYESGGDPGVRYPLLPVINITLTNRLNVKEGHRPRGSISMQSGSGGLMALAPTVYSTRKVLPTPTI